MLIDEYTWTGEYLTWIIAQFLWCNFHDRRSFFELDWLPLAFIARFETERSHVITILEIELNISNKSNGHFELPFTL